MKTKRHLVLATLMLLVSLVEAHLANQPGEAEAGIELTTSIDLDLRLYIETPQRVVSLNCEPSADVAVQMRFITLINGESQPGMFWFSNHEWLEDPQAMAELLFDQMKSHLTLEA